MPSRTSTILVLFLAAILPIVVSGCTLVPDIRYKPQYNNPFPQLRTIGILPFRNQSHEPTLSGERVSLAYYNELQAIPGFEVLPLGVVANGLLEFQQTVLEGREIQTQEDFQKFARFLGVDAVLQGAVTDFDFYYPPRMTLKVNWYAANPGYHPIPAGYGLPWGTKYEKKIPEWIRLEAERELATEQLKTQTPDLQELDAPTQTAKKKVHLASNQEEAIDPIQEARIAVPQPRKASNEVEGEDGEQSEGELATMHDEELEQARFRQRPVGEDLPSDWPDPQGFIPRAPSSSRPQMMVQYEPIISHMKAYNGNDEDFTEKLHDYYYFRDEVRTGGWKSYLQRSEDFIRFCCHLHVTETLSARGGQLESRMNLRWPIDRYDR